MFFTALLPPPPTPITLMMFSERSFGDCGKSKGILSIAFISSCFFGKITPFHSHGNTSARLVYGLLQRKDYLWSKDLEYHDQKIQHKGSYYRLALEGGDIGLY
jgi:hypothetical protein